MTEPERTEGERAVPGVNLAGTVAEAHGDGARPRRFATREAVFELDDVTVSYGGSPAVADVSMPMYSNQITALIGPSGCGKSTLIRCLNRMNDLIPSASVDGRGPLPRRGHLRAPRSTPVEVRKRIGMVFQKPNPFPKSIYDNIAFGPRILGMDGDMDEIVEKALAPGRALGRGQGPPRRRTPSGCPAASSSASASPAASRSTPT